MKCGILMDAIADIQIVKDTTFALLLAAQERDMAVYYMEAGNIWLQDGIVWGKMARVYVFDDPHHWYELAAWEVQPLVELDLFLMRKNPPFDMHYLYLTYLLEQAQAHGLRVINDPQSIRDANEKLFTAWFPQCCPKTLVTSDPVLLADFVMNEEDAIIKPLNAMGGYSVFHVKEDDVNLPVIIETMTENGRAMVMAQRFIPEIVQGDKRILIMNGEPLPYALARIPAPHDFRGNIAAGASVEGRELTERDQWICEQVGPTLVEKGLLFVGLDVIGDYLTEINVTSPTCVRELERIYDMDIASEFFEVI